MGSSRLAKGPPFQISGPRLADISIKTLTRRIATAAHPRRSWLKDLKVKVRRIHLLLGRRLSDAFERRNTIDRVELLDDFRIDVTAPERGQALFGQLGIVTDIAEQFLTQRPDDGLMLSTSRSRI